MMIGGESSSPMRRSSPRPGVGPATRSQATASEIEALYVADQQPASMHA
jgi:hypothetical protein